MKALKSFISKRSYFSQILITCVAFAIVCTISVYQINTMMRRHLSVGTIEMLHTSEANIRAALQEPEAALAGATYALRFVATSSDTPLDDIRIFLAGFSEWLEGQQERMSGFNGMYGLFYDEYVDGLGWAPDADYIPKARPWYMAAREAKGSIVYTEPYIDADSGEFVMSYSAEIFDGEGVYGAGKSIGVVALDVLLTRIAAQVRDIKITEGGFGVLLDPHGVIISHMEPDYIGQDYGSINPEFAKVKEALDMDEGFIQLRFIQEDGAAMICEFTKTFNGWYLGIITPEKAYFSDMYTTIATIIVLFSLIAAGLCFIIARLGNRQLAAEKEKAAAVLANESKSKFLATMSHEIRTPMNAIIGISQIQLQNDSYTEKQTDAWNRVHTAAYGLLGIINDILDLSKIETSKLELIPKEYDTPSLINDSVQLNIVRIGSKPIEFALEVDESVPAWLNGDELRVKQIINNILSNAIKYTDKGKVTLSVSHETAGERIILILKVADTGQGMTPEQLQSLFDEYARFNAETNRATEGTGLGMSITQKLVKLMDGEIDVQSVYGEGSVFTVRIAQERVNDEVIGRELAEKLREFKFSRGEQRAQQQITYTHMPYGRVLVVDDMEMNLFVAEGIMLPYGLNVETALSGPETIERVTKGERYDIIFLDHMMPEMDGIETCAKLRAMGYTGIIAALTANAVVGNDKMFKENGFDDFISKPIDIRQLDGMLLKYVRDTHKDEAMKYKNTSAKT